MDFLVVPNQRRLRDIAFFRGVDADETPDTFAVLGILADRDIDAILVKDRRRIDLARAFRGRIFDRLPAFVLLVFLGHAIEPPDALERVGVAFLDGRRIESVENAVAAPEIDLLLAVYLPDRR